MEQKVYNQEDIESLVQSMCSTLLNKVKLLIQHPKKNMQMAQNLHLVNLVDLISEQLIPQFCMLNFDNTIQLNLMHNLCYLLVMKVQAVFTSGVIRTCIDQNWDLKGLKAVLLRILKLFEIEESEKRLTTMFDKLIQSQNLQSQACIKAIGYFLKNSKKKIEEDDLRNPILTYQTSFEFVRDDIQHFRDQNMKPNCFSVLHPWAYDLDTVDFKYIVNRDLVDEICKALQTREARVFWLSFFKSQISCSADEFFQSMREMCEMNMIPSYFNSKFDEYRKFMQKCDYVLSVQKHGEFIQDFIKDFHEHALRETHFSVLRDQVRLTSGDRDHTEYIDESKIKVYRIEDQPSFSVLSRGTLKEMKIHIFNVNENNKKMDLVRHTIEVKAQKQISQKIQFKFVSVDTEELQGTEITFNGVAGYFKVGEGDMNHYQILNDKKLWESQFMIVNKNGHYYIRDLGIVHTSRIKVDRGLEVQLQKGSVVDMGKVIHYHFDKVTQRAQPHTISSKEFLVMRPQVPYVVEEEDPVLRGRPTWVSQDENKEMIQNEILISVEDNKNIFTVGRSVKRDIEIKLKAVSADHCTVAYSNDKGWVIHENGKEKCSSNGTFVFMKSQNQMDDHEPSDLIPLYDGMILSFINYELHVKLSNKDYLELQQEAHQQQDQDQVPAHKEEQKLELLPQLDQTMPKKVAHQVVEQQDEIDPRKHFIEKQKDDYMKKLHAPQNDDEPALVVKQPKLEQFPDIDEDEYRQKLEDQKKQKLEAENKIKHEEEVKKYQEETEKTHKEDEEKKHKEEVEKKHKEEEEELKKHKEEEEEKKKHKEEEEKKKAALEEQHKLEESKKHAEEEELKKKKDEEEKHAHQEPHHHEEEKKQDEIQHQQEEHHHKQEEVHAHLEHKQVEHKDEHHQEAESHKEDEHKSDEKKHKHEEVKEVQHDQQDEAHHQDHQDAQDPHHHESNPEKEHKHEESHTQQDIHEDHTHTEQHQAAHQEQHHESPSKEIKEVHHQEEHKTSPSKELHDVTHQDETHQDVTHHHKEQKGHDDHQHKKEVDHTEHQSEVATPSKEHQDATHHHEEQKGHDNHEHKKEEDHKKQEAVEVSPSKEHQDATHHHEEQKGHDDHQHKKEEDHKEHEEEHKKEVAHKAEHHNEEPDIEEHNVSYGNEEEVNQDEQSQPAETHHKEQKSLQESHDIPHHQ